MDFDKSVDKSNVYKDIDNFHKQVEEAYKLGKNIKLVEETDKIVITGMGGSALPGVFLKSYLNLKIPIFVVRDYLLPNHVNNKSLVFSISYSGSS